MNVIATPLVDWSAVGKIVIVAFAGGAGVVIAFGLLLLGLSRASKSTNELTKLANYTLSALAAVFCVGAVVLGIYAMAKKPASPKPKPAKSAATLVVPRARPDVT
jgi:NADH:ubiquinone oxidoreductase subunit 6 (subunit J)